MEGGCWPGGVQRAAPGWPCEGTLRAARLTRDRLLFMRKSAEIERVKREGRRYHSTLFNLVSCSSPEPHPRVGIIVGSRFGIAVKRNRAKRLFRELARQFRPQLVSHRAFLVFPRREALEVRFAQLKEAWMRALHAEGLLESRESGLR